MKKYLIPIIATLLLTFGIASAQTIPGVQQWFVNIPGKFLYPVNNTYNVQIPAQAGTGGCAYFDGSGNLLGGAGCSGGGGGSSATTTINGLSAVNYTFTGSGISIATSAPGTVSFTNTGVTSVSGSGSILSSGGTTPTIQLQNLTANDILFGQGSNIIGTSSNFTWDGQTLAITGSSTVSKLLTVGTTLTVSATSTLATTSVTSLLDSQIINCTNGVITGSGGLFSCNGSPFLTGNQTITLSGDVTGSGTTAITTTYNNIVPVNKGGTGAQALTATDILYGNGTNPVATSSNLQFTGSNTLAVTGTSTVSQGLLIGATSFGTPFVSGQTLLGLQGNTNNYIEANIQNKSNGATSSADFVATADNGMANNYFLDCFINSSGFINTGGLNGGPDDAGCTNSDNNLYIGGASSTNASQKIFLGTENIVTATGTPTLWTFNNISTTNASTTNFSNSGNSYLGTVLQGTWNGGVIGVSYGGTGTSTAPTTQGQLLMADSTGTKYTPGNLVAGSNITLTTSTPGQITIAASSSGGGSISTSTNAIIGHEANWTGLATLGNGALLDNGTVVGFNATSSTVGVNIQGTAGTNDIFDVASSSTQNILKILASNGVILPINASSTNSSTTVASGVSSLQIGPTTLSSPSGNGTYFGINAPTNFSGNFINFQSNGANVFKVDSNGSVTSNAQFNTQNMILGSTFLQNGSGAINLTGTPQNGGSDMATIGVNSSNINKTSGTFSLLNVGGANTNFNPTSGTAVLNSLAISTPFNQTVSANGITRGQYFNPALTSVYDYRNLETASGLNETISNAASPASQVYNVLFNPITYGTASTSVYTIATSSTVYIGGEPIASTTRRTLLTNSYGLLVDQGAQNASTTNAYAAYFVSPTGATNNWGLGLVGDFKTIGSSPTLSSCGGSPSIRGTDTAGEVTVGTVATGCTISFTNTKAFKPFCTITNQSLSVANAFTYTISTTAITVSQAAGLSGDLLDYTCIQANQ